MYQYLQKIALIFTVILVISSVKSGYTASSQPNKNANPPKQDIEYPLIIHVYKKYRAESLKAWCTPDPLNARNVDCAFTHKRINPPKPVRMPYTVEDAIKADPSLVAEFRKNPSAFKKEFERNLKIVEKEIPSGLISSKVRIKLEKYLNDPAMGPKLKRYYKRLLSARTLKELSDIQYYHESQTCSLYINTFNLKFRYIRKGQWLFQQETPGLWSNVLKSYELTSKNGGSLWTLTETRVPTQGANEKPSQTVWSWEWGGEYELHCDFISFF